MLDVLITQEEEVIEVIGARAHNLRNIDVRIPRNKLVVITGLSGSGKSSLAFDTIYAEGQRRYIETFSSYARHFLGNLERPDVDKISGLSPVISIEQKTVGRNPRSTVGTITEIYDFLRLLFARTGDAYSYNTGEKMIRYSESQITDLIVKEYGGKKLIVLAPVVIGRKGHYRELLEQILAKGFLRARIDGEIKELSERIKLDRYKTHDIEIVVDRIQVNEQDKKRVSEAVKLALLHGKGLMSIIEHEGAAIRHFSRHLMCPTTGISYSEPAPNLFSFNSPYGACVTCNGLGQVSEIDEAKIIPDKRKSIRNGGIIPLGSYKDNWIFRQIGAILVKAGTKLETPIEDLDEETLASILYGTDEVLRIESSTGANEYSSNFEGILAFIIRQYEENPTRAIQKWAQSFMNKKPCPTCDGKRLKKESLHFKVYEKSIAELAEMDITELQQWFKGLPQHLNEKQSIIARDVLKEISKRIAFLMNVGLDYLTLNRSTGSLSGGEAQRIRLASQIGSQLVGVLYILDEPSIGLHQRDNERLINALKELRDSGNSVIVVEHDKDMILSADHVIDIGPGAGVHGGRIIASGTLDQLRELPTLTNKYLFGQKEIALPAKRRTGNGKSLVLKNASGHNLKKVTATFPLGTFICVTGVSGSGKSSLINQTLYPILNHKFYRAEAKPLPYGSITGLEHLDKVIEINQSPIGRTPRSNPSTYTGMFTDIRNLFSMLPEAKIRGYSQGRFSFNVKGGRCEDCKGAGLRTIEMNFLPDVYVECETCGGKRYNRETLEVRFKGKSIADVLDMTVESALEFFESIPSIKRVVKTLNDVGLGYITLGQQSTTLSGGEAQRVKLASELSKKNTGKTFYILDEPSTGLHFEDIRMLLNVLDLLVKSGSTVLVIEHNLDIIKTADHIIDMGLEGGQRGGEIVCKGTPEQIVKDKKSHTARFLKNELQ